MTKTRIVTVPRSSDVYDHNQLRPCQQLIASLGGPYFQGCRPLQAGEEPPAQGCRTSYCYFDLEKKIGELAKMRLSSLREKENEKYDENISKLADEATKVILYTFSHSSAPRRFSRKSANSSGRLPPSTGVLYVIASKQKFGEFAGE